MRSLMVVAMLLVTGAAARAESFSFVIGGQAVRIGIGSGCADISCISVDVSGHRSQRSRRARNAAQPRNAVQPREEAPARPKAVPAASVPQDLAATEPAPAKAAMVNVEPTTQTRSVTPAQAPAVESTPVPMATEPAPETVLADEPKTVTDRAPTDSAPGAAVEKQAAAPAPAEPAKPVDAAAAAAPSQQPPTVIAALPPPKPATEPRAKSPAEMVIGTWSGSDGQLRIEPCGQHLCGYAGGGRHAGKMVLINMRQTKGNSWAGRVHDFKSGGTYSARMMLRGTNSLRVEGCAFGGMVCDGRTLARVN